MGKMMDQGPVLIITFQAQVVMVIRSPKGDVVEGDPVSQLIICCTRKVNLIYWIIGHFRENNLKAEITLSLNNLSSVHIYLYYSEFHRFDVAVPSGLFYFMQLIH